MVEPAAEGNRLVNSKRSCELFEMVPFGTMNHREARQVVPQEGSSSPQSNIARLPGGPSHQRKLARVWRLVLACVSRRNRRSEQCQVPGQKQFVAIRRKLGKRLRRCGYDGCCMSVCGSSKRQVTVNVPHVGNPLLLDVELAKTRRPRQSTIERSKYEWYRTLSEEERKRTRHYRRHRY